MNKRSIWASLLLAALLALPAQAADITPATTMREIRADPAIRASGLYTDIHTWERDYACFKDAHNDETLEEVVGAASAPSCAAGLNLLVENYEAGRQVTYKVYTDEEIAAQPSRNHWYGKSDRTLKLFGFEQQGPALQKALEADGVPYVQKVYKNAAHGIGIGLGTDAEGWLAEAGKFWRKVTP